MKNANTQLAASIVQDVAAEREKTEIEKQRAEAVYWEILLDAARTSEKDKISLADAMQTLGKTPAQAHQEASVIDCARSMANTCKQCDPLKNALGEQEDALREFLNVTAPQMREAINQAHKEKQDAVNEAKARLNAVQIERYELQKLRLKHPNLAAHFPPEAAGEGVQINGCFHDPDCIASSRGQSAP